MKRHIYTPDRICKDIAIADNVFEMHISMPPECRFKSVAQDLRGPSIDQPIYDAKFERKSNAGCRR